MDNRRRNLLALLIAVALPVLLLIFVPGILDNLKLSRKSNRGIKLPQKMYPIGVDPKTSDTLYHKVPNYKFQTQSGDSISLDSLKGSIYITNFFFATCPGICPKLSHSMERVQEAFIKDHVLKLVSITVDPEKDSLIPLRKYADDHNAIPGKWYFLRGSHEQVSNLAGKGLYITARPDDDGGPEAIVHSEKLVLIDWEGNIRGYYSGIDSGSVNKLMGDVVLLLRNYEKGFSFKKQKVTS